MSEEKYRMQSTKSFICMQTKRIFSWAKEATPYFLMGLFLTTIAALFENEAAECAIHEFLAIKSSLYIISYLYLIFGLFIAIIPSTCSRKEGFFEFFIRKPSCFLRQIILAMLGVSAGLLVAWIFGDPVLENKFSFLFSLLILTLLLLFNEILNCSKLRGCVESFPRLVRVIVGLLFILFAAWMFFCEIPSLNLSKTGC